MKLTGIISAVLLMCLSVSARAQAPSSDALNGQQWAVFTITPENAILTLDGSLTLSTRNGVLQVLLAPGMHAFFCESPYYESISGEFELKQDERSDISLNLVPTFGYVTVNSTQKKADIILDGENIGKGKTGSGRIMAGVHNLLLVRDAVCLYRGSFSLERGERKTIDIRSSDINPVPMSVILAESGVTGNSGSPEEEGIGSGWGGMNIHSNLAGAAVIVNGIGSGTAPCIIKPLRAGQPCRVTLKLAGYKDVTRMVKIKDGEIADVEMRLKKRR